MSDEIVDKLFAQARNEVPETTQREVLKWIGGGTLFMVLVAYFAKFKFLFISKPLVMISSIITVAGFTAGAVALLPSIGNNKAPLQTAGNIKPAVQREVGSRKDSLPETYEVIAPYEIVSPYEVIAGYETRASSTEETPAEKPFVPAFLPVAKPVMNLSPLNSLAKTQFTPEEAVTEFHTIVIAGITDIVLVQGDHFGVQLEADQEGEAKTGYNIANGVLTVGRELSESADEVQMVTAVVTVKDLSKIVAKDVSTVRSEGLMHFGSIRIEGGGASTVDMKLDVKFLDISSNDATNMTLDLKVEKLDMNLNGASTIRLEGKANELNLLNDGASDLKAKELKVGAAKIKAGGASETRVHVTDSMEVEAYGVAKVKFSGTPKKRIVAVSELAKFGRF